MSFNNNTTAAPNYFTSKEGTDVNNTKRKTYSKKQGFGGKPPSNVAGNFNIRGKDLQAQVQQKQE